MTQRPALTTNYDQLLEAVQPPPARSTYTGKRAVAALADIKEMRPVLFKVHGTAEDADSVVLTFDEYKAAHADESYRAVLGYLLVGHSFLFIGYGMADPNDLDVIEEPVPRDHGATSGMVERARRRPPMRSRAVKITRTKADASDAGADGPPRAWSSPAHRA